MYRHWLSLKTTSTTTTVLMNVVVLCLFIQVTARTMAPINENFKLNLLNIEDVTTDDVSGGCYRFEFEPYPDGYTSVKTALKRPKEKQPPVAHVYRQCSAEYCRKSS
ncbi:Hypothetical protein CINCED_3A018585 [Cinara cedri]|uniref:Uncharacterized protein n=1 Tax=Cinara cedri TaxID=506608 RepID=A0A5E4MTD4_9HEMI|nr:Hypothetical protein CINCED_3A018585 [Cinara cedri]